jgi:hypothetical protein
MTGLEPLIPIALFFSIAATAILRGPLGKALAERISGQAAERSASLDDGEVRAELDEVRYRLHDVEERLDFTERMLTRGQQLPKLEEGDGRDGP